MSELTEYRYECGDAEFSVYARNRDDAFDRACEEAAQRGLHDEELRLVDEAPYDPSGGDDDED